VREGEGVAARILVDSGADPEAVRNRVIEQLSVQPGSTRVYPTMSAASAHGRGSTQLFVGEVGLLVIAGTALVALAVGLLLGWLIWG
jgi:hypothetical protein